MFKWVSPAQFLKSPGSSNEEYPLADKPAKSYNSPQMASAISSSYIGKDYQRLKSSTQPRSYASSPRSSYSADAILEIYNSEHKAAA